MSPNPCSVKGCTRPKSSKGLCTTHYWRKRRGYANWDAPIPFPSEPKTCQVDGCERKHEAKGLCQAHYLRQYNGKADWDGPIRTYPSSLSPQQAADIAARYAAGEDPAHIADEFNMTTAGVITTARRAGGRRRATPPALDQETADRLRELALAASAERGTAARPGTPAHAASTELTAELRRLQGLGHWLQQLSEACGLSPQAISRRVSAAVGSAKAPPRRTNPAADPGPQLVDQPLPRAIELLGWLIHGTRRVALENIVTVAQYEVLRVLRDSPRANMAEVARQCHVTPQSVSYVLDNLEAAGMLVRTSTTGEGRSIRITLTDQAMHVLAEADEAVRGVDDLLDATLGLGKDAFAEQLTAIADALSQSSDSSTNPDVPRCRNNHPQTEQNTKIKPDGTRRCRVCLRNNQKRANSKKTAADVTPEQHGTATGYRYGCRCIPCAEYHTEQSRHWRAGRTSPAAFPEHVGDQILASITEGSTVAEAARTAGLAPQSVYARARNDESFSERLALARENRDRMNTRVDAH